MSAADKPLVTLAIPSCNQGRFLEQTLQSVFEQQLPLQVMLADGGSTDGTIDVIRRWEDRLSWWRSRPDEGQAAAINESIAKGDAPYVGWLNSDDVLRPGGLQRLVRYLEEFPDRPAVYAESDLVDEQGRVIGHYKSGPFSEQSLAIRCFISQPATLIRRTVWESLGGLDPGYHMAMDYDLWWRISRRHGEPGYLRETVAGMRIHDQAKTASFRSRHYREAMQVLQQHYGRVPLKWYLAWPYAVWGRSLARSLRLGMGNSPYRAS